MGHRLTQTKPERTILQPVAVASVCLVFIVLFLSVALMNLNALERTLNRFLQNRGLTVIKTVQQNAENLLQQLERTFWDAEIGSALGEESVSFREAFLLDVMDLAQSIDYREAAGRFEPDQLKTFAMAERIWLIAFFDEQGRIGPANRPIPGEVLRWAESVVRGRQTFKMDGFNRAAAGTERGRVALQRKSGRGTLVLALKEEGLRHRKAEYAARRAVEALTPEGDLAYVAMQDPNGRIIAQSGRLPENGAAAAPGKPAAIGVTTRKIVQAGRNLQEISAPFQLPGEFRGIIRLGLMTAVTDRILLENQRSIFISTAFMVLITCLAMWLLYKSQNRYLRNMRQMEERIHQAEKLSALGRLAAGVAHEIRNPLNAVSMAAQRLQRDTAHELTGVIRDEVRRLDQIIEEFLSLARSRKLKMRPCDLRQLLGQIAQLMESEAATRGIEIKTRWPETPCMVAMDVDKMKQALLNIIKNGLESIDGRGAVSLRVTVGGRGGFSVWISDTGVGLSRTQLARIFDPDYTTKEKGLGLGLSLAHEVIRAHGGEIHTTSQPGRGTTFEIRLSRNTQSNFPPPDAAKEAPHA